MPNRFRILLLCGTGIATSTAMRMKIEQELKARGVSNGVEVRQGKVTDMLQGNVDGELIVSTAQVPKSVNVPVINGVPLITGIGAQSVLDQVVTAVRAGVGERTN
jgi:PTS system galactitol-specific IIB component